MKRKHTNFRFVHGTTVEEDARGTDAEHMHRVQCASRVHARVRATSRNVLLQQFARPSGVPSPPRWDLDLVFVHGAVELAGPLGVPDLAVAAS